MLRTIFACLIVPMFLYGLAHSSSVPVACSGSAVYNPVTMTYSMPASSCGGTCGAHGCAPQAALNGNTFCGCDTGTGAQPYCCHILVTTNGGITKSGKCDNNCGGGSCLIEENDDGATAECSGA